MFLLCSRISGEGLVHDLETNPISDESAVVLAAAAAATTTTVAVDVAVAVDNDPMTNGWDNSHQQIADRGMVMGMGQQTVIQTRNDGSSHPFNAHTNDQNMSNVNGQLHEFAVHSQQHHQHHHGHNNHYDQTDLASCASESTTSIGQTVRICNSTIRGILLWFYGMHYCI